LYTPPLALAELEDDGEPAADDEAEDDDEPDDPQAETNNVSRRATAMAKPRELRRTIVFDKLVPIWGGRAAERPVSWSATR
jgi:hypothetical protein